MITNLTAVHKEGKPLLIGREVEMAQVIETLMRVEKPNVVLTGEPGVGKTEIVKGLAYLIANNLVPEQLQGYSVSEINLNDLLAGDGYRGVFEKKVQDLITQAVEKKRVILFMDEFHVAENLGKMANGQTPGFGNALKPYLTRPDIRIIGATTNDEYNKIEDKALLRRLRRVMISEPNEKACLAIAYQCIERFNITNVGIPGNLEERFYESSALFPGVNPDKIVDLADIFFVKARIAGLTKVSRKDMEIYIDAIVESKNYNTSNAAIRL